LLLVQFSVFSMNLLFSLSRPVFRTGLQRYALFFNFQIFLEKFLKIYFSASVFIRTSGLFNHPSFKWECKGSAYFLNSKFIHNNLQLFSSPLFAQTS